MDTRWAYLNDIQGCDVVGLYSLGSLLEIVYLKNELRRSCTINFHVAGGSKGFKIDSIPLPPSKAKHALSDALGHIKEVNLYASCNEQERYEELELVCLDGTYLCYFNENEDETLYAKIEKGKEPRLAKVSPEELLLSTELFNVEEFKEHLAFALVAHAEQKTPHGLPYVMHLLSVASEVINALSVEPMSYDEHNVAIACALLHDVNEDTSTRITKLTYFTGHAEVIAKGVEALTKDKSLVSKEAQMRDSLQRLKGRQNCVALVKLADRITNLGVPPKHWDNAKRLKYLEEAKLILAELGYAHGYLANKLQQKIDAYAHYICA